MRLLIKVGNPELIKLRSPTSFRLVKHGPGGQSRLSRFIRQLTFASRDPILADGVYSVFHPQHRLAPEVTLLQGHEFPTCSMCNSDVFFEFLRSVNPAPGFRIVLFTLPEIKNSDEETLPGAQAA